MNHTTVYVGMDVHKVSFSLCCYTIEDDSAKYVQKIQANYKLVISYISKMRSIYGDTADFICGYEAGCLGFSLYHQLVDHGQKCIILAPTTMMAEKGRKRVKTDKRDAVVIARCLACHTYHPVHIPTDQDEQVKEYIRMRDDHKLQLKKIKQQILAFCLRHGYVYDDGRHWTIKHLQWLRSLTPEAIYAEVLSEYLLTYTNLSAKLERYDKRIGELASKDEYKASVNKLSCFLGIKTATALSTIVEVGDFKRFAKPENFASYLGLTPGENSSGGDRNQLSITKAGNTHVRRLLVEAAQSFGKGQIGYKSKALKERQSANPPETIAYADKANERLRRKYYRLTLHHGKKANVAKTAVARELACFIWGMMNEQYA